MFFLLFHVGRPGASPDLEWLGVLTLRACWRYYIEPYSLCFIRLVLSPLVQFYRAFLPVKEGGLHYFSTTRAVGQTLRAGHSLLYPCFSNISPSLLGALPSYVTGGSVHFRVQWSEFLRADVRCGLRELIGDRTSVKPSDLFCRFIPSVALNANPCCNGFDLVQGLWGVTTLCLSV